MFNDNDEFDMDDDFLGDVILPGDEGCNNSALEISNNESFKKSDITKNSVIKDDNKKNSKSSLLHKRMLAPISSKYSSECNFDFEFAEDLPVSDFDAEKDLFDTQEDITPPDSEFLKIQEDWSLKNHSKEKEKSIGKEDFRSRILNTITNSKNKKYERIEHGECSKSTVSLSSGPDLNFSSRKRSISPDKNLNFIRKKQNTGITRTDESSVMPSDFSCRKNSPNQIFSNNSVDHFKNKNVPTNDGSVNYPSTSMVTPAKKSPPDKRTTVSPGGPVVCKRKFPGPAGLLPKTGGGRTPHVIGEQRQEKKTPPQSLESVVCSQNSSDDFSRGPWQQMLLDLDLDPSDPQCLLHVFNIRWILGRASLRGQAAVRKVPFLAVMLRNLDLRNHADATATLKDKTGEINGTIPSCVIEEHGSSLQPGCVLFLKGVTVLSPIGIRGAVGARDSSRRHYLNITLNTILSIYVPDECGNIITLSLGKINKKDMIDQAATPKSANTPRAIVEEELDDMDESSSVDNESLFSTSIVSGSRQNSAQPNLPPYRHPGVQSPAIRNSFNGPRSVRPGMAINNQRFQSPVSSQRFQGNRMQSSVNNTNRNTQPRAITPRFVFNPVINSSTPKSHNSNNSSIVNQVTPAGYRNNDRQYSNQGQQEQSSRQPYTPSNHSSIRNRNQMQPSQDSCLSQSDKNEVSQLFEDVDDESLFGDF